VIDPGLEEVLARAPDPEAARRRAEQLQAAAEGADPERWRGSPPQARARLVAGICGIAPFLTPRVAARPGLLFELLEDDLTQPRRPEELERRLDVELEAAPAGEETDALRRVKYAELARICIRDASPDLVPLADSGETLAELSLLADALLARSLDRARTRVAERVGAFPELRFAVLGLGKLGGGELNFSSDVDLVYVYDAPDGEGPIAPETFAGRLANEFGRSVQEATVEGFLYRVDLDLRPEGAQGTRAISADALCDYYDGAAAVWEKAAFMKARPVAGDPDFGWELVRRVHPMIYRSAIDFAGVASIRDMKARVEDERVRADDDFDVKLGVGGIRDLEFVAQAHQLLHGGRIPQLRGRSTQGALEALAAVGVLTPEQADALLEAYRFLRRLENRLQMEAERQTHRLPSEGAGRERAARGLGFLDDDGGAGFEAALTDHRQRVRETFDALFAGGDEERILELFARSAPQLRQFAGTWSMVEDLARHLARAVEEAADPGLALNNLDRFIQGVGSRSFYYTLLVDRPELVPRLVGLFGASKHFSNVLAAHPRLIEPLFSDPEVLVPTRAALEADLSELRARLEAESDRDPVEHALAALRLFHHRQLVNVGLLDLAGKIDRREAEAALSEIAEVSLEGALALAREQVEAGEGEFVVVGMGKLGSRELTYGSDLDVIFLYDAPTRDDDPALAEAQRRFARLAQRLIGALDTPTAEGSCYSVDARLRPSGGQGALVASLAAMRAYHERSAMIWERQALLRARPVAGSEALGRSFEALRLEILTQPLPDDLRDEIHRVRMRMESELAQESDGRRDLKTGRGGLLDVECTLQYLQLAHGTAHAELLRPEPVDAQLERIGALGLLAPGAVERLRAGWEFLQRLSSRLRIVQNRSISDLREDRADLDSVARALGYEPSSRSGDARRPLLEDYRRHTEAIRSVYLEVLGAD
jgi:glutamate-ammonia-ligase adenylyltransferase